MLAELHIVVRLMLLAALIVLTVRVSERGIQNGILLLLIVSLPFSEHAVLIRGGVELPNNLTLDRVVWPLLLLVYVWQWKQGTIHRHPPDAIEYAMGVLVVVIIANMVMHGTYKSDVSGEERLHFFSVLTGFFLPYMSYFMMRRCIVRKSQVHIFVIGVSLITLYLGLTGLGEAWNQRWLVFPKYILDSKLGIHQGFVRGPFLNATWNGLAMVMGLPLLLWLSFGSRRRLRGLWLLAIGIVGMTLPYILQRAVWVGAVGAVVISMLAWPKRGLLLLASVVLILAAGKVMMPYELEKRLEHRLAQKQTIAFRFRLLDVSYDIISDHMTTGVGFYRFEEEITKRRLGYWYSSHNTPLTLFAELGLLGFIPYVWIFSLIFLKSIHAYWQQPTSRIFIGGLWGITIAYGIALVSVDMRAVVYPNVLFFALWGIVLGITQRRGFPLPATNRNPQRGFSVAT